VNRSAVRTHNAHGNPGNFGILSARNFGGRLDLGSVIFLPYLAAIAWQYFAIVPGKALAWSITAIVSLAVWYAWVATKETSAVAVTWHFWLMVALPLLAIYALRADFPDISFDVVNYHMFESERVLRGSLFIPGDFFPASSPINPTSDIVTGLYRYLLGYRLGTIVNLLALIWTGTILNRLLRDYVRSGWLRNLSILFILVTEQLLFQINNYMVDLLALPLLLEAAILALDPAREERGAKRTLRFAFLLGMATAFKLSNLFVAVPIALVYLFNLWVPDPEHRKARILEQLKFAPLSALCFLAPCLPFTLVLYRLTGNPVFPLYNGIFKSPFWPQGAVLDPRWGPWGVFEVVIWPVLMYFKPYRLNEFTLYSGRLSLGYVLALVCLVIARREPKVWALAFITLLGSILWSGGTGYIRYALFLELTSGILLIWLVQYVSGKCAGFPRWKRLLLQAPLWLLLLGQSYFALTYVNLWEWSTRQTILSRDAPYRREYENFLRDRSFTSYLAPEELALFSDVDVWVETTYKTAAVAEFLKPHTPIVSVRMANYFETSFARQKFGEVLQAMQGKRMFTLTTLESMDEARKALAARGLAMGKMRATSIYYFSRALKFDLLLVEVLPSWQNNSGQTQAAEKGLPLPDMAFSARLSVPNAPQVMRAGQKYSLRVALRNDSKVIWPGRQPTWQYQLTVGNRWLSETGASLNNMDGRAALFQDLAPGESIEVPLTVTAPNEAGNYILQLDMIQEGVAWFGDRGSEVLSLKIRVE